MYAHNCEICGHAFLNPYPNAKFCGPRCRQEARMLSRRKAGKQCRYCGAPVRAWREFCNEGCRSAWKEIEEARKAMLARKTLYPGFLALHFPGSDPRDALVHPFAWSEGKEAAA